jgi:two-component system cell cycle sensor histidine kinase/response regulator CckA
LASRRQPLALEVLNLNEIIGNTSKMLERLLEEDIAFQFVPSPNLGSVKADANQIVQILMNLCLNARDAMPQGGKLTIETGNVELDDAGVRRRPGLSEGPYVLMAVSDTGLGMNKETRSHLFEPFFTTKQAGKGTGLGLATVYGIVKQHGGHIGVYSEPGIGTTFRIYFPRVDEPPTAIELPASESLDARGETILLVEDEEHVLKVTQRALLQAGYTVLTARTPAQAAEVAARHEGEIALLFTDVVLPDENGRRLYERLSRSHPGLRVLFMSGYTDNAIVHHGVLDHGVPFIAKPFTGEDILRQVRGVLDA